MPVNASLLVDSLGWALLHSIWQIALIAALVFVALRIIPRHNAQLRFVTAYGGLAASLLLFAVTWVICYRTIGAVETVMVAHVPPAQGWQAVLDTLGKTTWLISMLWGLGFTWLGVRYVQSFRATLRLKHEGTSPVPSDWEMRFRLWVERLGADPRALILQSSRITTPITIGSLKPIVLVPTGFFLRLPIDQAEAILVHEIAHICRQDYLLGLIQAMICNIFFFHPAIAYLSRQIDIEREYACDARVVAETGNTNALAQGLGKVALESRDMLPGFAMASDGGRTPLMDRITRLRERPFRRESGTTMPAAALTLMLAGCLTIAASADASFSSTLLEEDKDKDSNASPAAEDTAETASEAEVALTETPAPAVPEARASRTDRSEPKRRDNRAEDRWASSDPQGWSFDAEPGWTFSFRGSGSDSRKSGNASFQPVVLHQDSGLLRNAVLQTAIFEPDADAHSDECEDKDAQEARREARLEREEARREALLEREEARREREIARIERDMEREEARLDREMARVEARIEREMARVEREMDRVGEVQSASVEREMARLAIRMTALSSELESRMQNHAERARAIAERTRERTERAARRYRHSNPPAAPEPAEPPQPTITISFSIETTTTGAADDVASVRSITLASATTG
ncbi:MAG: M56 family metallopeptidase [Pseudomonadota bacterium]